RHQIRAIGVGLTACLALYITASSIPLLVNVHIDYGVRSILNLLALTAASGSIAYAMVQYKFLDAKLLARRGILYAVARAAQVGAGEPVTPEDLAHLRGILLRLPAHEASFRLADVVRGIDLDDRALLVGKLGGRLILPLRTRGETVGALLLGDKVTGTSYTSE